MCYGIANHVLLLSCSTQLCCQQQRRRLSQIELWAAPLATQDRSWSIRPTARAPTTDSAFLIALTTISSLVDECCKLNWPAMRSIRWLAWARLVDLVCCTHWQQMDSWNVTKHAPILCQAAPCAVLPKNALSAQTQTTCQATSWMLLEKSILNVQLICALIASKQLARATVKFAPIWAQTLA